MERRTLQSHRPQLLRSFDGKPSKIAGYAAVFYDSNDPGTEYQLASYGSFRLVERLMPGCFDRAIKEDDVRALFNHDVNAILGRLRSGTLRLSTDKKGLRYEIDAPDTTYARDLVESLKRDDVTGSSFCFDYLTRNDVQQRLPDGTELEILQVVEAQLFDVGPVTFPAYESSTAEARKGGSGNGRLSPQAMRRKVEKLEEDMAEFDQRLAARSPKVSRRRERIRSRCNAVVAEIERDGIAQLERDFADARRGCEAALARRK